MVAWTRRDVYVMCSFTVMWPYYASSHKICRDCCAIFSAPTEQRALRITRREWKSPFAFLGPKIISGICNEGSTRMMCEGGGKKSI